MEGGCEGKDLGLGSHVKRERGHGAEEGTRHNTVNESLLRLVCFMESLGFFRISACGVKVRRDIGGRRTSIEQTPEGDILSGGERRRKKSGEMAEGRRQGVLEFNVR